MVKEEKLKILVFCRAEPRHIYFANSICRHLPVDSIFLEKKPSIFDRDKLNIERVFFFGNNKARFANNRIIKYVPDINCEEVSSYLSRYDKLFICTFGCSIIKMDNAFRKNVHILNLHSGILPQYRGVHCVFWALYNKRPDMVGGSVHFVDRGIDSGDVITRIFPAISSNDDETALFNKTIKSSVKEFVKAALVLYRHGNLSGKPQVKVGKVYFAKDRNKLCEAKVGDLLRSGLLSRSLRKEKIEKFYESA
jgi:hypothetical protein